MRIFALELNNELKGLEERKKYIESLIGTLPSPDLVLLPELALPSYLPNKKIWDEADKESKETSVWAQEVAAKFNIFIGVGYADFEAGNYYNRYLIADKNKVYGIITKSEAEAAVFKRGKFDSVIKTPFGNIAVAICYDARRKHFYENIKNEEVSLIVFPHGSPASPKQEIAEIKANDFLCNAYKDSFNVPVVYINSVGKLEYMPGIMGWLMKRSVFSMNGKTKIYSNAGKEILTATKEAIGYEINLTPERRTKDITFYRSDIAKGNTFFRLFILKPDVYLGIKKYQRNIKKKR